MEDIMNFKTGLQCFDENSMPLLSTGELVVVAARGGVGKTSFIHQLAVNTSKENEVVLYSFELSKERVFNRMISYISEISEDWFTCDYDRMIKGARKEKLEEGKKQFNELSLTINEKTDGNINVLCEDIRKICSEKNSEIVFIDSFGFLCLNNYEMLNYESTTYIAQRLKQLAMELNICIVVTYHIPVNESQNIVPSLSDIQKHSSLDQYADKVIILHENKQEYMPDFGSAIIAKNRNGGSAFFVNMKLRRNFHKWETVNVRTEEN